MKGPGERYWEKKEEKGAEKENEKKIDEVEKKSYCERF